MPEYTHASIALGPSASTLFDAHATETLDPQTVSRLIEAAQDVPVTDDGERITYGRTPESEAAMERLVMAFLPMLHRASRRGQANMGKEDAFATAYEAFVLAVRRHDTAGDVHFTRTISTIVYRTVADAARTSDIVTVTEDVSLRYWRLIHKHGGDVDAAYAECRATNNGFTPYTFLAAHRAISATHSFDASLPASAYAVSTPGPEEAVIEADLVDWLFGLVEVDAESILRLRFGFQDASSETLRATHGYRVGELLDDAQAAHCLGLTRPTAQRKRSKAIDAMRVGMQQLADEELA
ncbi:hypothetical protein HPO96_37130 [Kribbella sandramycini]|uniref:Uncharacterized protein n=1 Tax=Kribbella sandramycini TaxID=60450 RepID=A0A7Y4L7N0_9ACTN|nr:hypothetical protein [Kribbella sandramycini]MBB6564425.1 hypothetical protein [Kribbella sandramycini]NOL45884.1 hypothetical protein [Kribbella sandramycini]